MAIKNIKKIRVRKSYYDLMEDTVTLMKKNIVMTIDELALKTGYSKRRIYDVTTALHALQLVSVQRRKKCKSEVVWLGKEITEAIPPIQPIQIDKEIELFTSHLVIQTQQTEINKISHREDGIYIQMAEPSKILIRGEDNVRI